MPRLATANILDHLPNEIVFWLVGHTVEEVECDLVIRTLAYHCGNRTRAANVLGISIRTLRNKIKEYEALGIAVPLPGDTDREEYSEAAYSAAPPSLHGNASADLAQLQPDQSAALPAPRLIVR